MRKFFIGVVTAVLVVSGLVSAQADQRIFLGTSSQMVFSGSKFTISPNQSVGEAYDYSLFRYEIVPLSASSIAATYKVRQKTAQNYCGGSVAAVDATYRNCSGQLSGPRTVLQAGSASSGNSEFSQSTLEVSAVVSSISVFGIRGWLDLNDNGQRDAYEPGSAQLRVEVLPISLARTAFSYEFEPPHFGESEAVARVIANNATNGMLERPKLKFRLIEVDPRGAETSSGSFTTNSHPDVLAYEMRTTVINRGYPARFIGEVWYELTDTSDYLLAREEFYYEAPASFKVVTSVAASSGESATSFTEQLSRGIEVAPDFGQVSYNFKAYDLEGEPLANQDVYFYLDLFDLPGNRFLKVGNGFLIPVNQNTSIDFSDAEDRDRVILVRTTDDLGEIKLDVSSSSSKNIGEIKIDFRMNGLSSYSFGPESKVQTVRFAEPMPTIVPLSSGAGSDDQRGRELNFLFLLQPDGKTRIEGYDVLATAPFPLVISNPIIPQVTTIGNVMVSLSRMAKGSGSSLVTLQLVGKQGQVSKGYFRVDWDSESFGFVNSVVPFEPDYQLAVDSIKQFNGPNLLELTGSVKNGFGGPLLRNLEELRVEMMVWQGIDKPTEFNATVDSSGGYRLFIPANLANISAISAQLVSGSEVRAEISCSVIYSLGACQGEAPYEGALSSWTKNAGEGSAKIYAKNIVGAGKVQFFLNGTEVAWVDASSTEDPKLSFSAVGSPSKSSYLVRTVSLVEGQKNVLEVYVDGVRTTRTAYTYN